MKRRDWIGILSKIVFWILSAIVIYWIILKLTDHSPTYDQVIITLLGILIVNHFWLSNKVSRHIGKIDEQMKESNRRFFALAKDFKKHLEQHS